MIAATLDLRSSADARADAAVIARVLAGDTQAFAEVVERYQRSLYRYAVSMVLDHDEAADLVQEAFVRAFIALRACRDPYRFRAWLFQVLRHLCLDYLKNIRRRNVRLDATVPERAASGDLPGARLERLELRADLRRALFDLPDLLREAFVMHYVNGLPYDTMADLLDVSVSALKMRVLRAREQLQGTLEAGKVTGRPAGRLTEMMGRLAARRVRRG
jgi:RNA polymerase sigma-70 factor (ECF subfamily)